jgi:ketosteroid isomerase-like protein
MAYPNVDLLRGDYDAFSKGDMDAIRATFADDIVAHIAGHSPIAGNYRGSDAVFEFFGKLFELSGGTFAVEVHSVLADDEHAAVLSKQTGQRDGKTLAVDSVELFHFRDGKISEFWSLSPDQDAEDDFWS